MTMTMKHIIKLRRRLSKLAKGLAKGPAKKEKADNTGETEWVRPSKKQWDEWFRFGDAELVAYG